MSKPAWCGSRWRCWQPQFEGATLKISPPPVGNSFSINLGKLENRTLALTNATLSDYRTLFAERLKLQWHTEMRPIVHLALVPGKNGPRLRPLNSEVVVTAPFQRAGRIAHREMPMETLTRHAVAFRVPDGAG